MGTPHVQVGTYIQIQIDHFYEDCNDDEMNVFNSMHRNILMFGFIFVIHCILILTFNLKIYNFGLIFSSN